MHRRAIISGDQLADASQGYDQNNTPVVNIKFDSEGGKQCAELRSHGAWFELTARKVVIPPPGLLAAMESLERTEDWVAL